MRFLLHLLSMVAIALAIGFGLSWYALNDGRLFGAVQIGPWSAWRDIGSPAPDPYTRAFIRRYAALQLGRSEGLEFTATADSDGQPLERNCRYRVEGTTPIASFWTLVPTAADGSVIARAGAETGFRSSLLARADDGSVVLYISKTLSPRNWLEITGDGPFQLVLNLYDTSTVSGSGDAVSSLPAIRREGCA